MGMDSVALINSVRPRRNTPTPVERMVSCFWSAARLHSEFDLEKRIVVDAVPIFQHAIVTDTLHFVDNIERSRALSACGGDGAAWTWVLFWAHGCGPLLPSALSTIDHIRTFPNIDSTDDEISPCDVARHASSFP